MGNIFVEDRSEEPVESQGYINVGVKGFIAKKHDGRI